MTGYVFIGDDFTGASDTLATLAERGAKVRLFLDAPLSHETAGLDAVGIATDLRARAPDEITERLTALSPAINALSPEVVHYKVCSTFDSAPHIGSIGTAVKALEATLATSRTFIVGGQPSLGRYCVFGNLFARGPDGETYRIDRHPIMSRHPVTPMREADLRSHLAQQGLHGLSLVRPEPSDHDHTRHWPSGRLLFDALEQPDVTNIGQQLAHLATPRTPILVVGATSVAEALFPKSCSADPADDRARWNPGPVLAIAGSRSTLTAQQVEAASSYARVPLQYQDLADLPQSAARCVVLLQKGMNVLLHLQPDTDYAQSSAELSQQLAQLTRIILAQHRAAGIAVAGGDTSSAIVKALDFRSLSFVERAGPGVAICRGHLDGSPLDGAILLLKGGQVGKPDLFERFAASFSS